MSRSFSALLGVMVTACGIDPSDPSEVEMTSQAQSLSATRDHVGYNVDLGTTDENHEAFTPARSAADRGKLVA
jgi:hypothetical protein